MGFLLIKVDRRVHIPVMLGPALAARRPQVHVFQLRAFALKSAIREGQQQALHVQGRW